MNRTQRYQLLSIFADEKEHNWFQIIVFGCTLLKVRQVEFEKILKQALEYNLIIRLMHSYSMINDDYKLSPKGDICFREETIAHGGDYDFYHNFDRRAHGEGNSLDKWAPIPKGLHSI